MSVAIKYLPERPWNPFRLGRHVEHDDRNRGFAWPEELHEEEVQQDIIWTTSGPLLNQADLGSCTGNTVCDVCNTDVFTPVRDSHHSDAYLEEGDALDIYHDGTVISAIGGDQVWPPADPGCTGPAVAQAGVNLGYFDRYLHVFTWGQFLSAISSQPVMIGSTWTNDMFNVDSNGVLNVGSLSADNQAGGHEYMVRAVLFSKSLVLMRNHWLNQDGTPWSPGDDGVKQPGEAYIPIPQFKKLLADQGDVTVPHGVGLS